MTKREIVFMCCRLLAVYLLMSSLLTLSQSLSRFPVFGSYSYSYSTTPTQSLVVNFNGRPATAFELISLVMFQLSPVILQWLGATLLWVFAREIAVRMFENEPEALTEGSVFTLGAEARALAFAVLGGFFLLQDVPNLVFWLLAKIWNEVRWTQGGLPFGYGPLWLWVVRIPICLWLIFGVRGLAGLWRLAQEKGIAPTR